MWVGIFFMSMIFINYRTTSLNATNKHRPSGSVPPPPPSRKNPSMTTLYNESCLQQLCNFGYSPTWWDTIHTAYRYTCSSCTRQYSNGRLGGRLHFLPSLHQDHVVCVSIRSWNPWMQYSSPIYFSFLLLQVLQLTNCCTELTKSSITF